MAIEDQHSEVLGLFQEARHELTMGTVLKCELYFDDWSEAYDEDVDNSILQDMLKLIVETILSDVSDRQVYVHVTPQL